jgi:hypothetical protein
MMLFPQFAHKPKEKRDPSRLCCDDLKLALIGALACLGCLLGQAFAQQSLQPVPQFPLERSRQIPKCAFPHTSSYGKPGWKFP